MIDFENMAFLKLRPTKDTRLPEQLGPMLCPGEKICQQYQGIRDGIAFTDRRIIAVNTQGISGKKKDFVVLPYSRIQAYSIESAGVMDFDSEMKLWLSGLGVVTFEVVSSADLFALSRLIDGVILNTSGSFA